jgi:cell division protein FtsZ
MIINDLAGVEFIAANTDAGSHQIACQMKTALAKSYPDFGRSQSRYGSRSAEESKDEIKSHLEGAEWCSWHSMGGGTYRSSSHHSQNAREMGILTLGIVSKPFPLREEKIRQR